MRSVQQVKVRITRSDGFRIPMGRRTLRTIVGDEIVVPAVVADMMVERGTAEIIGGPAIRNAVQRTAALRTSKP